MSRYFEYISTSSKDFKLPERSTKHSAGYDFYAPEDIVIPSFIENLVRVTDLYLTDGCSRGPAAPFCIKTQVKAYMQDDEVLQLYIRSSAPSKFGLGLANGVGIIDSDYYNNEDNEGEIGFLVYNFNPHDIIIRKGEKIGQGIFTRFLITDNDISEKIRSGGFGSTGE